MEQGRKQTIQFKDIKDAVMHEIKKRSGSSSFGITESVTLVEGFLNEPFSNELSSSLRIGGPTVPMIMLVGNETGKIYLFALKALLPGIWA